jgi:hypothetical protein
MSGGVAGGLVVLVAGLVVFGASGLLLVEVVDVPLDLQAITPAISNAMHIKA